MPAQAQSKDVEPTRFRKPWHAVLFDNEAEETSDSSESDAPYISGAVKHPFIYFRQLANRRWRPGVLFFFLFMLSASLKIYYCRA